MIRFVKYFLRPSLIGAMQEAREAGLVNPHEQPKFSTLPKNERFYIVFAHPFHRDGFARVLVCWERKGMGWWMDITLARWGRMPKEEIDNDHRFRM